MTSQDFDASQVWQRVHTQEHREQQTLQMLLSQLEQDRAFLQQQNENRSLVQQYAKQQQCLRGILMLTHGRMPRSSPAPLSDHSLIRCYDHALQRLAAYQLRSADPVYGPIFRDLSQETERHCRLIVQLLGKRG